MRNQRILLLLLPLIAPLLLGGAEAKAQFGSLNWGSPSNIGPPSRPYGKPPPGPPPRPYQGGPPPPPANAPPKDYNEDPIPPMGDADGSYDTQQLPAKLPILAPNGVVEIYNRVVDDLIRKLEGDLVRKEMDPMEVVIRPTPPGPVRVPGYLQKRPFRRPGAALYRSNGPVQPPSGPLPLPNNMKKTSSKKTGRSGVLPPETRFGDSRPPADGESSVRGAGKISKSPLDPLDDDEKELEASPTSTSSPVTSSSPSSAPEEEGVNLPQIAISSEERASSEEDTFMKARSEEFFPDPEEEEEVKPKKKEKKEESEEVEEDEEKSKDVDSLIQHYQSKNSKGSKDKGYSGKKAATKPVVVDPENSSSDSAETIKVVEKEVSVPKKPEKPSKPSKSKKNKTKKPPKDNSEESDEEEPEQRDDAQNDDEFDNFAEPGTGGGKRPNGGFYPPGGPPAVPAKPNAVLTGLSRIRRSSDVSVSVDARSAVITARLLVGPIHVVINDSIEPLERNVKATIPELEAELLLMERHGVVFLQRFTLDRAYGQDVEISIPKSKEKKNKNKAPLTNDPNHPANQESRRQTKMAAHVSMEVVKLLRSGNLRVNLMRTAQGAMSKLKLPIKKAKNKGKSGNKEKSGKGNKQGKA